MGSLRTALVSLVMLLAASPGRAEDLLVAMIESAQFCWVTPDGTPTGYNVDAARLLCARMGATCRFEIMPLKDLMEAVGTGRAQIGFGNLLRTAEREKTMAFSHPFWRSTSVFVGKRTLAKLAVPDGLSGQRVAVQTGSRQHAYVTGPLAGKVVAVETPDAKATIARVAAGDAELALLPMVIALQYLKDDLARELDFVGPPMDRDGLGGPVHIVVARNRPDVLERLDVALDGAVRDGSLHALGRKYLPFDIY